jgi:hypothetical protein
LIPGLVNPAIQLALVLVVVMVISPLACWGR